MSMTTKVSRSESGSATTGIKVPRARHLDSGCKQERERQRHNRNQGVARAAEKKENHQDNQGERDEQRRLDILDAVNDALRTVINGNDSNRTGEIGRASCRERV